MSAVAALAVSAKARGASARDNAPRRHRAHARHAASPNLLPTRRGQRVCRPDGTEVADLESVGVDSRLALRPRGELGPEPCPRLVARDAWPPRQAAHMELGQRCDRIRTEAGRARRPSL